MKLHENKKIFSEAIEFTAQKLGIQNIYVEKDYWITLALYEIFHSDIADQAVFKGGTALSKCHKLIERFSEDIDLVVLRNEGETDNQLKTKIRKISKVVGKIIPEIEATGLTNKKGNIRKTVHQYDKLLDGEFGQVRKFIVLEATWLGTFEPYSEMRVCSFIADMMRENGQNELVKNYNMSPFAVQVLSKERTFCEKIMSLVRFSKTDNPIYDLRNKIRHIYDIHQMLKNEDVTLFFNSPDFDKMLNKVGSDDLVSFKNNNNWVYEHPVSAMIFDNPEETWGQISSEYNTNFKDLVTGDFPLEKQLIDTLNIVAERLKKIDWKIS
jgi:predicted nucleotidyltransferase component of viral defense system